MPLAPEDDEQKTGGLYSHWQIEEEMIYVYIKTMKFFYFVTIIKPENVYHISFHLLFTEYRNVKTKFSNNNRPQYQPPIVISDTSQRRLVNQANTNNITHATVDHIYSTSPIAEGVYLHLSSSRTSLSLFFCSLYTLFYMVTDY